MSSHDREHDVVLERASPLEVELAGQLLDEAGIPWMVHEGPAASYLRIGMGQVSDSMHRNRTLLVPIGLGPRARAILAQTWGPEADSAGDEALP